MANTTKYGYENNRYTYTYFFRLLKYDDEIRETKA